MVFEALLDRECMTAGTLVDREANGWDEKSLPFGTSEAETARELTPQSSPESRALGLVEYRGLIVESLEQLIVFRNFLIIGSLWAGPTTATSSTSTTIRLLRSQLFCQKNNRGGKFTFFPPRLGIS